MGRICFKCLKVLSHFVSFDSFGGQHCAQWPILHLAQALLFWLRESLCGDVVMDNFTPGLSLVGGILIGVSASMMLLMNGRIAGISGILGGLIHRPPDAFARLSFLGGLLLGGVGLLLLYPDAFVVNVERSTGAVLAAGLLVGFGTRLGNGCTSGHGVCGLSRLSLRSAAATGTFMLTGALTALVITQVFGGVI